MSRRKCRFESPKVSLRVAKSVVSSRQKCLFESSKVSLRVAKRVNALRTCFGESKCNYKPRKCGLEAPQNIQVDPRPPTRACLRLDQSVVSSRRKCRFESPKVSFRVVKSVASSRQKSKCIGNLFWRVVMQF